jgi:hypothetical protein
MHMLKMIALATLAACAFAIPVTKDDHQAGKVCQPHDSHPPCPP